MLALTLTTVKMDKARAFQSTSEEWEAEFAKIGINDRPVKLGWLMADLNADGVAGHAEAASVALGLKLLDSAADGLATFLEEFDRMAVPKRLPR